MTEAGDGNFGCLQHIAAPAIKQDHCGKPRKLTVGFPWRRQSNGKENQVHVSWVDSSFWFPSSPDEFVRFFLSLVLHEAADHPVLGSFAGLSRGFFR